MYEYNDEINNLINNFLYETSDKNIFMNIIERTFRRQFNRIIHKNTKILLNGFKDYSDFVLPFNNVYYIDSGFPLLIKAALMNDTKHYLQLYYDELIEIF